MYNPPETLISRPLPTTHVSLGKKKRDVSKWHQKYLRFIMTTDISLFDICVAAGADGGLTSPPQTAFHVIRFNWVGKKKKKQGIRGGWIREECCLRELWEKSSVQIPLQFVYSPRSLAHTGTPNHSRFSIISMSSCAFEVLNPKG